MKKFILLFLLAAGIASAQTYIPSQKDVNFPGRYTHQASGDTLALMVYVVKIDSLITQLNSLISHFPVDSLNSVPKVTISTASTLEDVDVASSSTSTDTVDFGDVKEIIGITSSSDFDSSAVTFSASMSGAILYDVWADTAIKSVNLDSSAMIFFSQPIYARRIKINYSSQTGTAKLTLIYR